MKWIYLAVWILLAWRDIPGLWRAQERRALIVWLLLAGSGLALAAWYFQGDTQWRLAEYFTRG